MATGDLRLRRTADQYSLAAVDDVSIGVYSHFVVHSADTANLRDVPDFAERFAVTFGGTLHLQFLEVVFAAVFTRMSSCNSFGALDGDWFQGRYRESFGGVSESGR